MSSPVYPRKLRPGDTVRVVAPSRSRALVMEHDNTRWIDQRFREMGLHLSFGERVDEDDAFRSASIASRVADLHAAFADPEVAAILTVIGGFNSNELLPHLDWELIAANPKILCGYSDITALSNAIFARTGLVGYSGPHWSTFGMRDHFEPTGEWFRAALTGDEPVVLEPSQHWTDDLWFADQDDRTPIVNDGWLALREGEAAGRVVGGNLCTLNLLQGTPYKPSLDGALLFVEDAAPIDSVEFARNLTSLLQVEDADGIAGLAIGRFQRASRISAATLDAIVARQPALAGKPVLAGLDFGHTSPMVTFPIGGEASLRVGSGAGESSLVLTRH